MVELDVGKSPTEVQSMQLHKLLDINEEEKLNDTKYEVKLQIYLQLEHYNLYVL